MLKFERPNPKSAGNSHDNGGVPVIPLSPLGKPQQMDKIPPSLLAGAGGHAHQEDPTLTDAPSSARDLPPPVCRGPTLSYSVVIASSGKTWVFYLEMK